MHPQKHLKDLWQNVLIDMELSISAPQFKTWFKDTAITKMEDGVVFVGVPTEIAREWLSKKHHKMILKSFRKLANNVRAVEFVVSKQAKPRPPENLASRTQFAGQELPLGEHYINRSDNLNPRYTFDTFIVGSFNEMAHGAAQAVVRQPGMTYNPLFIYGNTGYGKTHLIQAVGNQVKKLHPNLKVFYVTSEKYLMDYVASLQNNTTNTFKEKYRQYDLLIMDDIQFFSQKEKTQEELFHLFNHLYQNNKQIVFSSDKHPHHIQHLEDRLKSRFAQGMIIDISQPDKESRLAILQSKVAHHKFDIHPDIVEYIAENVEGNIRELEGIFNTMLCQTQLRGKPLPITEVKRLVRESARPKKNVSIKDIVRKIAEFYDIEEPALYEKTRRKEVVKPRQLIMFILREDYNISYPLIGEKLGGRDHTTVMHSCERIKKEIFKDPTLQQELDHIRILLK